MNLRRTFAISRRIADLFRRDHRSLALVFVAPIVIMALLGWVIRDQAPTTTRIAVVDLSSAPVSVGELIATAAADNGMQVVDCCADEASARAALAANQIDLAVVIPAGFSPLEADRTILILTQGLIPTEDSGRLLDLQLALRQAFDPSGITIDHQTIYGSAEGTVFDALAPALVGFVVFFLVFILTGISFLRERMGGTLERLLATPVRRSEIVVGYSVGFAFFAVLQVALILLFVLGSIHLDPIGPLPEVNFGLGVPIAGSVWLAFVIMVLLAISAVNLGIFLSTFARTELQILQFIPLVIVPQALLSGIAWPVESLPGWLEPIARLLPMTYGIDGLREVLIKGSGLGDPAVQLDIAVLAGVTVMLALLATLTIRREVA
ncbi:MAG TPA: ABC transporter permease [Candidatus Limnocylindrales bacterium]|nr:ABC transporter permease [Candidatus Limnocylindrales bacterium]